MFLAAVLSLNMARPASPLFLLKKTDKTSTFLTCACRKTGIVLCKSRLLGFTIYFITLKFHKYLEKWVPRVLCMELNVVYVKWAVLEYCGHNFSV